MFYIELQTFYIQIFEETSWDTTYIFKLLLESHFKVYLFNGFTKKKLKTIFAITQCAVDFLPKKAEADDVLCALFDWYLIKFYSFHLIEAIYWC